MRVGASSGPIPVGCVGAGTGAVTGGIKGGLGSASEILETGLTVTALVAVNSLGSVISPATGLLWKVHLEVDGEFGLLGRRAVKLHAAASPDPPSNTTNGAPLHKRSVTFLTGDK